MITGIYAIDGPNGRRYVGQAINIPPRWRRHIDSLTKEKLTQTNPQLQRDWTEFGPTAFTFRILELCDQFELDGKEKLWMRKHPLSSLYNGQDEKAKHRHQGKIRLSNGRIFENQWTFAIACGYANPNSVAISIWRGQTYDQIAKRRGLL